MQPNPKCLLALTSVLAGFCVFGDIGAARADPVGAVLNVDFTGGSQGFNYDGGTFTFYDNGSSPFDGAPVSVMTNANAEVSVIFGQLSTYFDPVRDYVIFDNTSIYASFPTKTVVPYSATPSFIGLAVAGQDGTHYGYAEFDGTYLEAYAFESDAGVGILPGAQIPEPASIALLGGGLLVLTALKRYRASR